MVSAARAVAGFDSASAMTRMLGHALRGRDAPLQAEFPRWLEPGLDRLLAGLERLPEPAVQAVYRRAGWLDAIPARQVSRIRSDKLAAWVTRQYPRRRYPVVFAGSSNGALIHLAAALGVPWLPQTLLVAVRHGGLDPDDPAADLRAMAPAGRALTQANPDLALHHMHDPSQDRLMIARMTYFRVKWLRMPQPYRAFLTDCLAPGGTVVLTDCSLTWPVTEVGDRHVFQFGALGGASAQEFHSGGERVTEFLRQQGAARERWLPPPADRRSPEAEWGFAGSLADDVESFAARRHLTVRRLRLNHPEDASPLVAELFRDWYSDHGRSSARLLVSSFLLMDPLAACRAGLVPYWALFGCQPTLARLEEYLSHAEKYDSIDLAVFPHGIESIGLPSVSEWQAVLDHARRGGRLLAVPARRYPRHFHALSAFHREVARLPSAAVPPMSWEDAARYLTARAAAHNVSFA